MPPSSAKTQVFFWPRCFVMRTRGFAQSGRGRPYQRLAATLLVSVDVPFRLRINDTPARKYRVALLSPDARRHELHFEDSDSFLFDIGLSSPEYARLRPLLRYGEVLVPDRSTVVLKHLAGLRGKTLDCTGARQLLQDVVDIIAPPLARPRVTDPRIAQVLQRIDALPRDELRVAALAAEAGLSESRLRSLAQRELGCSLSRYMRWIAAWRSAELWRPGMSLTDLAHAAGFHDLPHANRVFNELFGMPPSRMLRSTDIAVTRCGD